MREAFPLIYEHYQNLLPPNSRFIPDHLCRPPQPHVIILTAKLSTSTIERPMPLDIDNGLQGIT